MEREDEPKNTIELPATDRFSDNLSSNFISTEEGAGLSVSNNNEEVMAPRPTTNGVKNLLDNLNPVANLQSHIESIPAIFGYQLPGPEVLERRESNSDGELVFVAHLNGNVSAHAWDMIGFQWVCLGQLSYARGRIEGSLAVERLRGQPGGVAVPPGTLEYFRAVANQRVQSRTTKSRELKSLVQGRTSTAFSGQEEHYSNLELRDMNKMPALIRSRTELLRAASFGTSLNGLSIPGFGAGFESATQQSIPAANTQALSHHSAFHTQRTASAVENSHTSLDSRSDPDMNQVQWLGLYHSTTELLPETSSNTSTVLSSGVGAIRDDDQKCCLLHQSLMHETFTRQDSKDNLVDAATMQDILTACGPHAPSIVAEGLSSSSTKYSERRNAYRGSQEYMNCQNQLEDTENSHRAESAGLATSGRLSKPILSFSKATPRSIKRRIEDDDVITGADRGHFAQEIIGHIPQAYQEVLGLPSVYRGPGRTVLRDPLSEKEFLQPQHLANFQLAPHDAIRSNNAHLIAAESMSGEALFRYQSPDSDESPDPHAGIIGEHCFKQQHCVHKLRHKVSSLAVVTPIIMSDRRSQFLRSLRPKYRAQPGDFVLLAVCETLQSYLEDGMRGNANKSIGYGYQLKIWGETDQEYVDYTPRGLASFFAVALRPQETELSVGGAEDSRRGSLLRWTEEKLSNTAMPIAKRQ